jgi:hypothetical protein
MFTSWKSCAAAFAAVATMAVPVLGLASPAGAAGGGNSAAAHACQKGGWQNAQTGTGGSFTSQDDCVSFGARGGTVFTPTVQFASSCDGATLVVVVSGNGFHPNSTGTSHVVFGIFNIFAPATTDASGHVPLGTSEVFSGSLSLAVSFVDAQGVHASTTMTLDSAQCAT